jgi:hypothetical protein
MNVKELILSRPAAGIAAALVDRLDFEASKRDRGIHRITALIDSLRGMEPETTDYMLLSVYHMYDDKEFLDANLYCKSELPAELTPLPEVLEMKGIDELPVDETEQAARAIQLPQGYAFELSPWREVLGYEVNIANAQEVGIAALCAAVLYEMTFFDFDEEAVEAERQKLYDSLHEAEELDKFPPEERAKHFFSAEEVFAGLGIPEPSEEERQEAHRQMCREMLINNHPIFYTDLQKGVCTYENTNLGIHFERIDAG